MFLRCVLFIVGDAIKNPKEQKIAEENNGKRPKNKLILGKASSSRVRHPLGIQLLS
jgi:hypothetical protein